LSIRLWIDVEDLFEYARGNKRPSGIQRLAFEIYRALQQRLGDSGLVQFVRHDVPRNSFRTVLWSEVANLFEALTDLAPAPTPALPSGITPRPPARRFVGKWLHRLAPSLRPLVINAVLAQSEALRAWGTVAGAISREVRNRLWQIMRFSLGTGAPQCAESKTEASTADMFGENSAPGDVLLVLGSPWSHPDYAALVSEHRERGLRFALLVYDLIPIRRPEWCDRGLVRLFRDWFQTVLPLCDVVFAISQATARDVERYAHDARITLPAQVQAIPIGTGFGVPPPPSAVSAKHALPRAGSYALFVSTIEARKNHALLFRTWRQLLEDMKPEEVPTLVFAGRVGWMVGDLMHQIANTDHLNGKLVVIEDPTDTELAALYGGCLFTLFPSLYEGWGLPVTESLAFGKPCIISNRTSLPEAGGALARIFDPDNLHDAYRVIRQTIEDRADLARWEARVRREFRPVPWSATVDAILAGLRFSTDDAKIACDRARVEPREEPQTLRAAPVHTS
jgi:glycosyltransferase involved in cell wall biosynthesis